MRSFWSPGGTFIFLLLIVIFRVSGQVSAFAVPQYFEPVHPQVAFASVVSGESPDVLEGNVKTPARLRALLSGNTHAVTIAYFIELGEASGSIYTCDCFGLATPGGKDINRKMAADGANTAICVPLPRE